MRLEDVWIRYGRGPWVLRGVTAQLGEGEAATIVGRNGAGKSTLLGLAAGLLQPNRGRVTDRPSAVGYVPERFPADQPFTTRRYLTQMAAVQGRRVDAAGFADELSGWADRFHIAGLLDRPVRQLSKGSVQKVGIIQAMLGRPELLILDEPWEGLDEASRHQVPLIVTEVLDAGGRVLISDHQGHTADLYGLRRWNLRNGVLTDDTADAEQEWVVEVSVVGSTVEDTVAGLKAAGHQVLSVRARSELAGAEPETKAGRRRG